MMKNIKAILFDMDGVLVDTEDLHCKSYISALKRYEIKLTEEEYFEEWTQKGKGIKDYLKEKKIKLDAEEIRSVKRAIYHQMLKKQLMLMPGIKTLLEKSKLAYKTALVSSSYRVDIDLIVKLTNIGKYFDVIIAKDDVKKVKPEPESFLLAAKLLEIEPRNCIVVEDAEKGVVAAKRAGMICIAIPCRYTMNNDFSLANYRVEKPSDVLPILKKY
ncbi:MAG: HAD family phosphatase [Candidatus Micrarchaeota archaeon]|nr:HAD family phosphatase [Candidatus Micrarchaeota archaeon]